jgi:hypothetical protein
VNFLMTQQTPVVLVCDGSCHKSLEIEGQQVGGTMDEVEAIAIASGWRHTTSGDFLCPICQVGRAWELRL